MPRRGTKARSRIRKLCAYPEWWFKEYFGYGIIREGGCQFESVRNSANSYEITTTCEIRKLGQGVSHGVVLLKGNSEYEATIETKEGGRVVSRKRMVGKRIKDCP